MGCFWRVVMELQPLSEQTLQHEWREWSYQLRIHFLTLSMYRLGKYKVNKLVMLHFWSLNIKKLSLDRKGALLRKSMIGLWFDKLLKVENKVWTQSVDLSRTNSSLGNCVLSVDNSFPDFSSRFQTGISNSLLGTSTWMSKEHQRFNFSKS